MRGRMTLPAFRELPPEIRRAQRALLVSSGGRRSRPSRTLVLAALLAILVATPALALRREMVDFLSSEPAPERIQVDFDSLRERTAESSAKFGGPRFTPDGPARAVMRVEIDGETRPLWVVPTREGGFCIRLNFGASCLTPEIKGEGRIAMMFGLATKGSDGMNWFVGRVSDQSIQEVELMYQDGERVNIPFVWVSPPIDTGFYAYDVPAEREEPGRLAVAVVGLAADGGEVAHTCLLVTPDELARSAPEVAALCPRHA